MKNYAIESKRRFLKALVSIAFLLPFSKFVKANTDTDQFNKIFFQELFFCDAKTAKLLGKEYLDLNPDEADSFHLKDKLCSTCELSKSEVVSLNQSTNVQNKIKNQISLDFEKNRITNIKGWILPDTELRIFALAYLS